MPFLRRWIRTRGRRDERHATSRRYDGRTRVSRLLPSATRAGSSAATGRGCGRSGRDSDARLAQRFDVVVLACHGDQALCLLADEIYAPNAYFRDPFNEVRSVPAIRTIFGNMFEQLGDCRFRILETLANESGALLIWDMTFRFRRFRPGTVQTIHGASHLKFIRTDAWRTTATTGCRGRALRQAAAHRLIDALLEAKNGVGRQAPSRVAHDCQKRSSESGVLTQLSDSAII